MSGSTFRNPQRWRPGRGPWVVLVFGLTAMVVCGASLWKVRRDHEREARAAVAKAQEELRLGQPDSALQSIAKIPVDGPWEADILTVKGLAFAAMDRADLVRPVLQRSLALKPNQPIAAKVLAAVYFASEEPDRGFALLEQAARLDPTGLPALVRGGRYPAPGPEQARGRRSGVPRVAPSPTRPHRLANRADRRAADARDVLGGHGTARGPPDRTAGRSQGAPPGRPTGPAHGPARGDERL